MITDAQTKALLTFVEYTARQVVELRADLKKIQRDGYEGQRVKRLQTQYAKLSAEHSLLKKQYEELIKFQ